MPDRMTVEELAAATGMTVRNIREHQSRGLLPPPALEGRKGYYDERHLARLRLIRQLQEEGLNLHAIGWLLARAPAEATEEIVRFEQALFAPWGPDEPRSYTTTELAERLGPVADRTVQRAQRLGLLRAVGDGRWEAPSPRLVDLGAELVELGISLDAALDVVEAVIGHVDGIAASFVGLFVREVWEPFDAAGRPPEGWAEVRETLERLRPIATETVLAVFRRTMGEAVARRSNEFGGAADRESA